MVVNVYIVLWTDPDENKTGVFGAYSNEKLGREAIERIESLS